MCRTAPTRTMTRCPRLNDRRFSNGAVEDVR
jgi:hypothetical protein